MCLCNAVMVKTESTNFGNPAIFAKRILGKSYTKPGIVQ